MKTSFERILRILFWLIYSVQSLVYLLAGAIHLDEGAYMYASRAVYQGKLPYRDFFFLQPPLHPYIYGLIQKIQPGLLTGRLTSIGCGLIAIFFLSKLVEKHSGSKLSSLLFLALMAMTPFQIYFFTITRLYALTTLFLAIGCYLLFDPTRESTLRWTIGLTVLSLALGTRLTLLPFIAYGFLYVLIRGKNLTTKLLPILSSLMVILSIYLPFVLTAGIDRLWFNLLGMNLSLHSNNLSANLIQKARATSQLLRFYFPIWLLFIPVAISALTHRENWSLRNAWKLLFSSSGALWVCPVGMLLVHSSAKLYQVSYQTIIMPLFMAALTIALIGFYKNWNRDKQRISGIVIAVMGVLSLAAYGRTSIAILDGKPALFALWEQADFVRENTEPGQRLFSADSALVATEADRDILTGMAGSDLFAEWSTEKCRHYNVLNFEIMDDYIANQDGALLAYGDLSFGVTLPSLDPISESRKRSTMQTIHRHYRVEKSFPNLMLPGTRTHYCLPGSPHAPSKFLLFGLDAAAWDVVLPLCQRGLMPTISGLMETGVSAQMKTLDPTVSVMLWTTIATGMLPEHHGINNWLSESMDSSGQLAITSDRRKTPAFWNIIEDRNILVSNWWATWPVEPIHGIMLSNRSHFDSITHAVHPEFIASSVVGQFETDREQLQSELNSLNPESNDLDIPEYCIKQLLRDRFYLDHTARILAEEPVDMTAVFVRGIDILEHEYLRDVLPDATSIPAIPETLKGIVQSYYRYVDAWLAKLIDIMGPDTGILIVSDHGMDPVSKLPPLLEGLDLNTLLIKMGETATGKQLSRSWSDTFGYPPGLTRGLAWKNSGIPTSADIAGAIQRLQAVTVDGSPLFTSVEPSVKDGEQIRITLNPLPTHQSTIQIDKLEIPVMAVTNMIIHPRSGQHWHSPDGIFIMAGKGVKASQDRTDISILDIMPTLTAWTGSPVSRNLDGTPRIDFFTEEFLSNHPIGYIDKYGRQDVIDSVDTPDDVEADIRKELESLGYIQSDGDR